MTVALRELTLTKNFVHTYQSFLPYHIPSVVDMRHTG